MKKVAAVLAVILLVLVALRAAGYRLAPQLQLPARLNVPDPAQEQRFGHCVESADHALHERTFATVDNPDVQRELLASGMERSREECRRKFPERVQIVERPFRIRFIEPIQRPDA